MPKFSNFARRAWKNLRVLNKPLSVHTEAVVLDDVWEKVMSLAFSGKVKTWHVMTPANFEHMREHLNLKMSKVEFSSLLKKRYLWLLDHGQRLELHVHLNKFLRISRGEQEVLFDESVAWARKELGLKFREFVPGWFQDNHDTLDILRGHKIRRVGFDEYRYIHDYDLIR